MQLKQEIVTNKVQLKRVVNCKCGGRINPSVACARALYEAREGAALDLSCTYLYIRGEVAPGPGRTHQFPECIVMSNTCYT